MTDKILTNKEVAQELLNIINSRNPEDSDLAELISGVSDKLVIKEKEKIINMLSVMEFNMTLNNKNNEALLCKAIKLHIEADLHHNSDYIQKLKHKMFITTDIDITADNKSLSKN